MPFVHGSLHLSRKGRLQILLRRVEAAEAVVGVFTHDHGAADVERCVPCRTLARWREARAVHAMTEVPKPLARERKRDDYAAAVGVRLEAAETIVEEVAKGHWGRCEDDCRTCQLLEDWTDAKFVHEAIGAYADRRT